MQGPLEEVPQFEAIEREGFLSQANSGDVPDADWSMDPDQIAILLFTSGTTGAPKAAVLRHSHLVSYILGSVEFMGAGDEEATLVSVPPTMLQEWQRFAARFMREEGSFNSPILMLQAGSDLAIAESITHAIVVPTMLSRIVEELENCPGVSIDSLETFHMGAVRCPAQSLKSSSFISEYKLCQCLWPSDGNKFHYFCSRPRRPSQCFRK